MASPRRLLCALSILAVFSIPSFAKANVGESLERASGALDDAVVAAEKHGDGAAFDAFVRANQKFTAKAERQAAKLRPRVKRARAMRRVAVQHDENLNEYADLIEWVPAGLQEQVVNAVALSAAARQQAIETLMRLAERLPEPARTAILEAVARLQTDGDLEALLEALGSDEVLDGVKALIREQVELISAQVEAVLAQLGELSASLPPEAAAALAQAISMIEAHIGEIGALIDELLGELGDGNPFAGLGDGALCDLFGGFVALPICD